MNQIFRETKQFALLKALSEVFTIVNDAGNIAACLQSTSHKSINVSLWAV